MDALTDAQALLLAAQYVVEPDLTKLQVLASKRHSILTPTLLYRLLITYLPVEPTAESTLIPFLQSLQNGFQDVSDLDDSTDKSASQEATVANAEEILKDLRLDQIPRTYDTPKEDLLTDFLVEWSHKIESVNGISQSTLNLINSFAEKNANLRDWQNTYLLPLSRLQNDFYPGKADSLSLQEIENVRGLPGVNTLLQFAEDEGQNAQIRRDLDDVVTPWVAGATTSKRRRIEASQENSEQALQAETSWNDVNEWILLNSKHVYELSGKAVLEWNGPRPINEQDNAHESDGSENIAYVQTALAIVYTSTENGQSYLDLRRQLLHRAAELVQLMPPDTNIAFPSISDVSSLLRASKADLLENSLLRTGNPLTTPSTDAVEFLHGVLATQQLLEDFRLTPPTSAVASTALFDSEERQRQELRAIINQLPRLTKSNLDWETIRKQLIWLHSWQANMSQDSGPANRIAYLSRVSPECMEVEILNAMLTAGEYSCIARLYLKSPSIPLDRDTVKDRIVAAMFNAYDNASNGNRTRGGIKRASDILKAFQSHYKDDVVFKHIDHLIKATHSLSFYQLTLQHGVPFQPVNIRVHRDPLSLIEKILDQNPKAYTKLDDLLEIGRHLVLADLPTPLTQDISLDEKASIARRLFDAEHRITYQAITSALADHDFDTAYSYITTRLSTSPSQNPTSPFIDDTSWRAAYAAGKYRPSSSSSNLHERIASLSKRMDLLSLALTLAPTPEPLSEILGTWRRCEEEMDNLKSQAVEEERAFEAKGNNVVPGGFGPDDRDLDAAETRRMMERRTLGGATGPSYEEEAPVGLFDVARGAANAFRKSAFPLRGGQQAIQVHQAQSRTSQDSSRGSTEVERPGSADGQQRVRKRDMLSSAVTGGLVSGMSWVLGAQPLSKQEE